MTAEDSYPAAASWKSRSRRKRQSLFFALVALSLVLPLLLGLPVLYWQARQAVEADVANIQEFALGRIEAILTHAGVAANEATSLIGNSCVSAARSLRKGVTAHPFVRSMNLVENGRIYCSSLEGAVDYAEESSAYADGRLRMMPGNLVTPTRAVVVYRRTTETGSVLVGIDGQHLFDVLSLGASEFTVKAGIGDAWVDSSGVVTSTFDAPQGRVAVFARSSRYPFDVGIAYDTANIWLRLRTDYWPSWLLLALLGALSGYTIYRFALPRTSLTAELQRAVEADEFVPFYQPVVLAESGQTAGVEVLARWIHPSEGTVPPNQFIPLAERTGLIVPMTYRLMERVKQDLSARLPRLPVPFHVGINICAAHCTSMDLLERCMEFLAAFPPGSIVLVLELTEREAIPATPLTDELFKRLDQAGVQVALDDFGTGNSSLEYLQRFTVNALKIDQSFVAKASTESPSRHILDVITDLASRLNLELIAEGVETEAQRQYLRQLGVKYMQGYLFGRPVPFDRLSMEISKPDHRPQERSS